MTQELNLDSWRLLIHSPILGYKKGPYPNSPVQIGPHSPSYVFCPLYPLWEPFSRMQPLESNVLLRPSGLYMSLNPVKASINFKILARQLWRSTHFVAIRDQPCKFPCLLNLTYSNLEWPASSVSPCPLFTGANL